MFRLVQQLLIDQIEIDSHSNKNHKIEKFDPENRDLEKPFTFNLVV